MNKKFNIIIGLLVFTSLSACQQAPPAENIDGIYVES